MRSKEIMKLWRKMALRINGERNQNINSNKIRKIYSENKCKDNKTCSSLRKCNKDI